MASQRVGENKDDYLARRRRDYSQDSSYARWSTFCRPAKKSGVQIDAEAWRRLKGRMDALGGKCHICDESCGIQLDHAIPSSRGGPAILANVALLCGVCNRFKSNMKPLEFAEAIVGKAEKLMSWATRYIEKAA